MLVQEEPLRIDCGQLKDSEFEDLRRHLSSDRQVRDIRVEPVRTETGFRSSVRFPLNAESLFIMVTMTHGSDKPTDAEWEYLKQRVAEWCIAHRCDAIAQQQGDAKALKIFKRRRS